MGSVLLRRATVGTLADAGQTGCMPNVVRLTSAAHVGREEELDTTVTVLARLREGRPSVVMVIARLIAQVLEADAATVADALDEAVAADVIVADGTGYRMRHELLREAVYQSLPPARRRDLHYRTAGRWPPNQGPTWRHWPIIGMRRMSRRRHWPTLTRRPRRAGARPGGGAHLPGAGARTLRLVAGGSGRGRRKTRIATRPGCRSRLPEWRLRARCGARGGVPPASGGRRSARRPAVGGATGPVPVG